MKPRNTILLLLLAAGLFAFIFFRERFQPTTREEAEINAAVMNFNPELIDGILINNNEAEIRLHAGNGIWRMDSPVADRADLQVVAVFLTVAATLQKEGTLAQYDRDIDPSGSAIRLKLSGKGAPPEIFFGKDAAVEGRCYIKLAGSDTVYVARNGLKKLVMKKADEFRDHRLTDVFLPQINRFTLKTAAGEIDLRKNMEHWEFDKPFKARADSRTVGALISRIVGARIEKFIPEKEANAAATGLAEPRGTVTVFSEGRDKPEVVQIGLPDGIEKVYARVASRDSDFLLSSTAARVLETAPDDLRDTHLLPVNPDIVDRITIEPAGKPAIVLARNRENWTIQSAGNLPVNPVEIKRFTDAIQNQRVTSFIADVASDLAKYGLDRPRIRVTFSSYASENTAESRAGEQPVGSVSFGTPNGREIPAMIDGEPFVVGVDESLMENIYTDAAQWRELPVFSYRPGDIVSIELAREGRPPVAFTRTAGNGWKLAKGEGVLNEVAVQSLCNALASLRAVRRTGPADEGLGFDKPAITVSFATSDHRTARLVIGNLAQGSMWHAMANEADGAFILSRPDVEVMQADFISR